MTCSRLPRRKPRARRAQDFSDTETILFSGSRVIPLDFVRMTFHRWPVNVERFNVTFTAGSVSIAGSAPTGRWSSTSQMLNFTNTGGALPTSVSTNPPLTNLPSQNAGALWWNVPIDAGHSSISRTKGGAPITISTVGTGTHVCETRTANPYDNFQFGGMRSHDMGVGVGNETAKGVWDWSKFDACMDELEARGGTMIMTCYGYSPFNVVPWASNLRNAYSGKFSAPPLSWTDVAENLTAILQRYNLTGAGARYGTSRARISYVEIWNEPAVNRQATFTVDATTNVITLAANVYAYTPVLNDVVWLQTTDTFPGNLGQTQSYFIIAPSGMTAQLALTPGGAAVDISSVGAGVHTLTKIGNASTMQNGTAFLTGYYWGDIPTLVRHAKVLHDTCASIDPRVKVLACGCPPQVWTDPGPMSFHYNFLITTGTGISEKGRDVIDGVSFHHYGWSDTPGTSDVEALAYLGNCAAIRGLTMQGAPAQAAGFTYHDTEHGCDFYNATPSDEDVYTALLRSYLIAAAGGLHSRTTYSYEYPETTIHTAQRKQEAITAAHSMAGKTLIKVVMKPDYTVTASFSDGSSLTA